MPASDAYFYIRRTSVGAYLDHRDQWQTAEDYGQRIDSLANVRHNIDRLKEYSPAIYAAVAGCSDARGRVYPLAELFR